MSCLEELKASLRVNVRKNKFVTKINEKHQLCSVFHLTKKINLIVKKIFDLNYCSVFLRESNTSEILRSVNNRAYSCNKLSRVRNGSTQFAPAHTCAINLYLLILFH